MSTSQFFDPKSSPLVLGARNAVYDCGFGAQMLLAAMTGKAGAIILAEAGIPVTPLDDDRRSPLCIPTTDVGRVSEAFSEYPNNVVGYHAGALPFSLLFCTRAAFAAKQLKSARRNTAARDLAGVLRGADMQIEQNKEPIVAVVPDPLGVGFYIKRSGLGGGEMLYLGRYHRGREGKGDVMDCAFAPMPAALVDALAHQKGLRDHLSALVAG